MITTLLSAFLFLLPLSDPPAGTIKVKNFYVDKTEILNIHWMEYLKVRGKDLDSLLLKNFLPHQSNRAYALYENRFKPLVLITYEQAIDYCQWRSEVVSKRSNKKITYRLPTPEEWQEIAQELLVTEASQTEKDLKSIQKYMLKKDGAYHLLDISQPKEKVYHFFNNVSEMTLKKGTAIGLSNYDLYKAGSSSKLLEATMTPITYTAPHPYLGFRCIAVIEK